MNNSKLTSIGLNKEKSKELADSPNDLLSNYSIFYQNSKGYQWNIQEDKFFELHVKFEELYNDLFLKIDEIAERIIILSYKPNHKFSDYSKTATIKESINVSNGINSIEEIRSALQILIIKQRDILHFSSENKDDSTMALMSDYIRIEEKQILIYSAFLKN
tara:strand:+ start:22276 stop:22758 length:483 start_codon:yes stop_codon:yes gene_type:complete